MKFNAQQKIQSNGRSRFQIDMSTTPVVDQRPNQYAFQVLYRMDKVYVRYGYRKITDTNYTRYPSSGEYAIDGATWIEGGVVYMTRTNPVYVSRELVTPGVWSEMLYGTPPAETKTLQVVRVATTETTNGVKKVFPEHLGNIVLTDWGDC